MAEIKHLQLASASMYVGPTPFGENVGTFYTPYGALDNYFSSQGLTPEKLLIPKDYKAVLQMCYDFYQRGGMAATVINRLEEFSITEIRNGQRKTSDEANDYFKAVLHRRPSRLMRFLHNMAREYYIAGMVLPRIDWVEVKGSELSPKLKKTRTYLVPQFDLYPPKLVNIEWVGWGQKAYYIEVPSSDLKLVRGKATAKQIKEQQKKLEQWMEQFPEFVQQIQDGHNQIELKDVDPIVRKELTITQYPTPFLYNVLEPLVFKQQLRRMDFAVASRIINAILLVQEGSDEFPLTADTQKRLDDLKNQILARANDPRLLERLQMLFTNHTVKITWITPDVNAMLDQDKYRQTNEEIDEGLGFTRILVTGEARSGSASEVSTWAIQPMMEEFRMMALEWIMENVYEKAADLNNFRNIPEPVFKTIKLQDLIKTAAMFAEAYKQGIISRTTWADAIGTDYQTETELMRDEAEFSKDLPAFPPTPYSPLPPDVGQPGQPGRPLGSQNVPVNNRNSGVKPSGQKPLSRIKAEMNELWPDELVVEKLIALAEERGIIITKELLENTPPLLTE